MGQWLTGEVRPPQIPDAFENHSMPLNPQHVQAGFLSAVECHEPTARAAVLDRECATDAVPRRRVEALLRAHEEPISLLLSVDEWLDRWRAFRRQSPAAAVADPHLDLGAAPSGRARRPDTSAKSRVVAGQERTEP
jgi:hypothetical protein